MTNTKRWRHCRDDKDQWLRRNWGRHADEIGWRVVVSNSASIHMCAVMRSALRENGTVQKYQPNHVSWHSIPNFHDSEYRDYSMFNTLRE